MAAGFLPMPFNQLTSYRRSAEALAKEEPINQLWQIMQNKPNLPDSRMNVSPILTKDYVIFRLRGRFKNKANQTQYKANLLNAQMNVNKVLTKDYENVPPRPRRGYKAK